MAISIEELLSAPTAEAIAARILTTLSGVGFPITSWSEKSVPRRLIKAFAEVLVDGWSAIAIIAAAGLLSKATGGWLELLALEFFGIERYAAMPTQGGITLTASTAAPTYTKQAREVIARSTTGALFRNVSGFTLTAGASITPTWEADVPGVESNVAGETIVELATPLAGVVASAAPGISWITTQGTDQESEDDLRGRCRAQWSTIGAGGTAEAIAYHCKSASAQVTRVRVYEATPVPGKCTIILAGPAGGVNATTVAAVATYLEDGRRIQCVTYITRAATNRPIDVAGTAKVSAGKLAEAKAYVDRELAALGRATVGGGIVDLDNLRRIVRGAPGVTHTVLTYPPADVALAVDEVPVLTRAGLSWVTT